MEEKYKQLSPEISSEFTQVLEEQILQCETVHKNSLRNIWLIGILPFHISFAIVTILMCGLDVLQFGSGAVIHMVISSVMLIGQFGLLFVDHLLKKHYKGNLKAPAYKDAVLLRSAMKNYDQKRKLAQNLLEHLSEEELSARVRRLWKQYHQIHDAYAEYCDVHFQGEGAGGKIEALSDRHRISLELEEELEGVQSHHLPEFDVRLHNAVAEVEDHEEEEQATAPIEVKA